LKSGNRSRQGSLPDDRREFGEKKRNVRGKSYLDRMSRATKMSPPAASASAPPIFPTTVLKRYGNRTSRNRAGPFQLVHRYGLPDKRLKIVQHSDCYGKRVSSCGDSIELYLSVRDDRIRTVSFLIQGCLNTNAYANTLAGSGGRQKRGRRLADHAGPRNGISGDAAG